MCASVIDVKSGVPTISSMSEPEKPPENVRLRTVNLNLFYSDFQSLRDISVDFADQAINAIIGPSGCGKSSLLRTLNRMNDLIPGARVEGKIEMDGRSIYGSAVDVVQLRKRIGMVFQRPNPFPMSIHDNIAFGPKQHGKRRRSGGAGGHPCMRTSLAHHVRASHSHMRNRMQLRPHRPRVGMRSGCDLRTHLLIGFLPTDG